MALLLKYVHETGAIVGVWESTTLAVLQAQPRDNEAVYGYLLSQEALSASVIEQDYVVQAGALVPRPSHREER